MRMTPRWGTAVLSSLFLHAAFLYAMAQSAGFSLQLPSQENWPSLQVWLQPANASLPLLPERIGSANEQLSVIQGTLPGTGQELPVSAGSGVEGEAAPHKAPLLPVPDTGYLPARELDSRPSPVAPLILPFPEAPLGGSRATAVLLLYIGSDGNVDRVEIEASDLPAEFELAAVETFRLARMQPGMKDGKSVRALMKIMVEYESE